jgi:alkaline phosphatase
MNVKIHSQNDMAEEIPFLTAFENKIASIEIDVFLKDKTLLVLQEESEIIEDNNIESLYLKPMEATLVSNNENLQELQFLIDFKSNAQETLVQLINTLEGYPSLTENDKISFVISGNKPPANDYLDVPKYISFDHQSLDKLNDSRIWNKVALISLCFSEYSNWQGESELTLSEFIKLKNTVDLAHKNGQPIRFSDTPNTELAWKMFEQIGVDYITTDNPAECALYFEQ